MRFALVLLFSYAASATPVRWTLSGFQLDAPVGTATGSFVYDADTGTYSNIDITTPGFTGSVVNNGVITYTPVPPRHYTFAASGSTGTRLFAQGNNTYPGSIVILFAQPLTNAGGTVVFLPSVEIAPSVFVVSQESVAWGPVSSFNITAGAVIGTPFSPSSVPAISPGALFILCILLAGCAASMLRISSTSESR